MQKQPTDVIIWKQSSTIISPNYHFIKLKIQPQ